MHSLTKRAFTLIIRKRLLIILIFMVVITLEHINLSNPKVPHIFSKPFANNDFDVLLIRHVLKNQHPGPPERGAAGNLFPGRRQMPEILAGKKSKTFDKFRRTFSSFKIHIIDLTKQIYLNPNVSKKKKLRKQRLNLSK